MEDWNTLAADCVVISCCCQCLILQIVIFVLLRVPYKLIQKTKAYAKKKLVRHTISKEGKIIKRVLKGQCQHKNFREFQGGSGDIQLEEFPMNAEDLGFECCMKEVEKVLEEFSEKGEFAFGSFWGRQRSRISRNSSTKLAQHEFDQSSVQFEVVEIVASLSYSS
ncbi:Parvalbumin [Melia azedarach]|uniref:Parvalbumin n=1 Tax=Melia azedarach TaxID=155640 RepID=A0ACC1XIF9_MELAZ|nr:Parvalbumin [Melia azedarach]